MKETAKEWPVTLVTTWDKDAAGFCQFILERDLPGIRVLTAFGKAEIDAALRSPIDLIIATSIFPGGLFGRMDPQKMKFTAEVFRQIAEEGSAEWGEYRIESLLNDAADRGIAAIVSTGSRSEEHRRRVLKYPRTRVLYKPPSGEELFKAIEDLLTTQDHRRFPRA